MRIKLSMYRKHGALLLIAMLLGGCGYYPPINVLVVDAETEQPIEGAVLLSQWTIASGMMGFNATSNFKVVEAVSDENGMVRVEGVSKPGVDKPSVTVYKKGYVAWNNDYIFPKFTRRKGFKWRDGYVFKLEQFKPEYSHRKHAFFIDSSFSSGVGNGEFMKAWRWENLVDE